MGEGRSGQQLRVGRWHVEPSLNQISDGPTTRRLEPQVMDLLVFLLSHPGRVLSKDALIAGVWQGRFISDATLTRAVADLRRVLDDDAARREYIETIPKRGYRLIAEVRELPLDPVPSPAAIADPPRAPQQSLAVLPFANFGGESDGYFCDGLTEEIINVLARIPGLRVISRTSAFAMHGCDVAEIARRLRVAYVLEGSVRRAEDRIRVTAQLIEIAGQSQVWSERFDRPMDDVFAIQDDLAAAIARRLQFTIDADEQRLPARARDLEAYRLLLQGRQHFAAGTPQGLEQARDCYARAIARDPAFALAHDALAEVFWFQGFYGLAIPKDAFNRSLWECVRALEIDDRLAEAHSLLAMLRKELDYDWSEVDREFARAFALEPQSPTVRFRYAVCGLLPRGRSAEAAALLQQVVDRDPLSIVHRWWLASACWFSGQDTMLREQAAQMRAIDETHPLTQLVTAQLALLDGGGEQSVRSFEQALDQRGRLPWLLGWLGMTYAAAGRDDRARAVLAELMATSAAGSYVPPFSIAIIYLALADLDEAFRWMDRAIDVRDPHVIPLLSYPFLEPIRRDPRYRELLAKMNLPHAAAVPPEVQAALL